MATMMATKTDEELQEDVLDEMKWDARLHPNEIGVAVKDGVVWPWMGRLLHQEVGRRGSSA